MYLDEVMAKAVPPFPLETRYPVRRQAIISRHQQLKRSRQAGPSSRGISLNECQVRDVCDLLSAHVIYPLDERTSHSPLTPNNVMFLSYNKNECTSPQIRIEAILLPTQNPHM